MKESWRKYSGLRAPRYTSYPSALHFDGSVAAADLAEKLAEVSLYEPLSVYVHVPFCRQLCWYCGCNMRVENDYSRARDYVDAMVEEIVLFGRALDGRGRPASVHFGGGTPNFLEGDDIARILSAIECEIGLTDSAALAIELDPRMLRADDADRFASLGFSRFSLGIQDFDPTVQKAINRRQSFELVAACVSDVRAAGVADLSFDIVYGLPNQTASGFSETIGQAVALSPDRISVFGYAHMPSEIPRQRLIDPSTLPDDDLRAELSQSADSALLGAGFLRIGFDHYAKPENALAKAAREGRLKRNFQGFTDDAGSTLIAVGVSAISYMDGLYAQNEKDVAKYVSEVRKGAFPIARGLKRTKRESVIAEAINNLLCNLETDVAHVLRASPPSDAVRICAALEQLETDGVIRWRGDVVALADGAHGLSRAVAAAIDPYARTPRGYPKAL